MIRKTLADRVANIRTLRTFMSKSCWAASSTSAFEYVTPDEVTTAAPGWAEQAPIPSPAATIKRRPAGVCSAQAFLPQMCCDAIRPVYSTTGTTRQKGQESWSPVFPPTPGGAIGQRGATDARGERQGYKNLADGRLMTVPGCRRFRRMTCESRSSTGETRKYLPWVATSAIRRGALSHAGGNREEQVNLRRNRTVAVDQLIAHVLLLLGGGRGRNLRVYLEAQAFAAHVPLWNVSVYL